MNAVERERLINQIVITAVAKVPKETRETEAGTLRRSLGKAGDTLERVFTDDGWIERCLRRMGEQYTTFVGQPKTPKAGKQ
jgi:hypothetical protein